MIKKFIKKVAGWLGGKAEGSTKKEPAKKQSTSPEKKSEKRGERPSTRQGRDQTRGKRGDQRTPSHTERHKEHTAGTRQHRSGEQGHPGHRRHEGGEPEEKRGDQRERRPRPEGERRDPRLQRFRIEGERTQQERRPSLDRRHPEDRRPDDQRPSEERAGSEERRPSRRSGGGERRQPGHRRSESRSAEPPAEPIQKQAIAHEHWEPAQFVVPPEEGKTRFHDLNLPDEILHAVADLGFQYCTPIQAGILPKSLAGQDVTGRAQTGTGKSAAFIITILTHILRTPIAEKRRSGTPRALIMAPTRELALQIQKDAEALAKYTAVNIVAVLGGMEFEKQTRRLRDEIVDIVVATPGRLIDFKHRGSVHLGHVEILVIDEADRMLDMGFIPDMRRIIESTPSRVNRQTMLFSATITPEVHHLASLWTRDASLIDVTPEQMSVEAIDQVVYITTTDEKFTLLYNMITKQNLERVLVFANRRDETRDLKNKLREYGMSSVLLSGDVPQERRIKALENFREGKIRVLVATDVAGRGLHVEGISHVVNYNLPMDPEDYVHRIGRTGRAGASGISVSFACEDDSHQIPEIQKYLGRELSCIYPPEEWLTPLPPPLPPDKREGEREVGASSQRHPRGRHGGGGGNRGGGRGRGRPQHRERGGRPAEGRSEGGGSDTPAPPPSEG